ncbi:MAG: glycosyltransferase [Cyclobacteriaceae bacterium]|nr:glycosyltransferase [Cyclobacteriaceae bacterium]
MKNLLHFSKVINNHDFIDVVVKNANPINFKMMASSYRGESNIENPYYEKAGIPFFNLEIDHGWFYMFWGAWRLSRILRRENIDILHTHHYYEAVIGTMACLMSHKTRHIVGRHYHDQFYLTTSGAKLWFYLFVEKIVNSVASAIIVPSTAIVELLKRQGVSPEKIKLIPYPFDFSKSRYNTLSLDEISNLKQKLGINNKFVIGNIARHHNIKGQLYLIEAFHGLHKQLPDILMLMIGDGPFHSSLCEAVEQRQLQDAVVFAGWRKDAHRLINCMDVVVHPTLQEAFPQIMIETMALGVPLVITPVSGATDVIEHYSNGFIVPFKNIDKIVRDCVGPVL